VLSILIVEDGDNRIEVLRRLYAQHELTVCRDGQSAMTTLRTGAFDLIHLDHDLEGELTGVDVAEKIRLVCPETPVIVHSENPIGANSIARVLPSALQVPISKLSENTPLTSQLKALLADSEFESADRIITLLREE
jgi:CheY-like chemotaxis protein